MNAETVSLEPLPRWAVMWLLAGGLFLAGKAAVLRNSGLRGWRLAGFAAGWVGMDVNAFKKSDAVPWRASWGWSLANLAVGVALLWGAARCCTLPLAAGWVGMAGLIFVLHFGLFRLLADAWNAIGVPVTPIMRCPLAATSLAEFWGRRWNLAFRDLSHRLVFRPVAHRSGHKAALWASFAVSGLAHELVISLPAGAGFGLPTCYFLLQALGIALERGLRTHGWLRTHAFTALPAIVLFHPPFVERVMVPFFHVIGALP